MIEFLKENYEWLFWGIGVTALFFIIDKFVFKSKAKSEKNDKKEIKNKNSITINNNIGKQETQTKKDKSNLRILFIDDQHTKFKMVSILKKSGWKNTNSVKDITDLDDYKAKEADIIFVDINGVGKTLFKDEGLGSALKKKYPEKKIVIYSSETKGDRFHKALREVDDCLSKNAEPYQFINLIETLCQ